MTISKAKHSSYSSHLAAQRALEERLIAPGQIEVLMAPGLVRPAFASERGIKAVALAQGVRLRRHRLDCLSDALDDEEKIAIQAFAGIVESCILRKSLRR